MSRGPCTGRHLRSVEMKETALRHGCEHEDRFITLFYGEKSPLSNFFRVRIHDTFTGKHYPTAEHYYQARKSEFFGDKSLSDRIRRAPSAFLAKRMGQRIPGFNKQIWREQAKDIMKDVVRTKFEQYPHLRHYLLHFTNASIAECTRRDQFFGNGVDINDENCFNPSRWNGRNVMGEILQELKFELSE